MKHILRTLTILAFVVMLGKVGYSETHYGVEATIISASDSVIEAEDTDGNIWEFEADELEIGQKVVLVMADYNQTSDVTDDEVEDVKALN